MIEKVKKAKELKGQGVKVKDMEAEVGISRNYIPKLLELYDAMLEKEDAPVINNPDYVVIRKQKYITLSNKIQNKLVKMREEYLQRKRVIKMERNKLLKAKQSYGTIRDLHQELRHKQLFLNITSKNLQHAEDGYEYLKREVYFNYLIYFFAGVAVTLFSITLLQRLHLV